MRPQLAVGAALIATAALLLIFSSRLHQRVYPVDSDGVRYLHAAESLTHGGGLRHRPPLAVAPLSQRWEPLRFAPPGYSLLLAAGATLTGIPVLTTALRINDFALMILPLAIYWLARQLGLSRFGAAAVGVTAATSPGAFGAVSVTRTELVFTICVVASLALFARGIRQANTGSTLFILSGLLAGASTVIRHAGWAMLLAVPLSVVLTIPRKQWSGALIRNLSAWMLAAMVPVSAMLIQYRAVYTYPRPRSPFTTVQLGWQAARAICIEIAGWGGGSRTAAIPAVIAFMVGAWWLWRSWPRRVTTLSLHRWPFAATGWVAVGAYVVCGLTLVLAASARYQSIQSGHDSSFRRRSAFF
jgi:hypothetical protein